MTEYEKACNEVDSTVVKRDYKECAINWIKGSKIATVCFPTGRMNSRIRKLAEKYPEEVIICHENADGSIIAHVPVKSIKVSIRKGKEITEEQRQAARERFLAYHKSKQENDLEDTDFDEDDDEDEEEED